MKKQFDEGSTDEKFAKRLWRMTWHPQLFSYW